MLKISLFTEFDKSYIKLKNKKRVLLFLKVLLLYIFFLSTTTMTVSFVALLFKTMGLILPISKTKPEMLFLRYGQYTFLIVAILGPMLEETVFRLSLVLRKCYINISLIPVGFILCYKTFPHYKIFILVIITFVVILSLFNYFVKKEQIVRFGTKYKLYIVWGSIVCFTLVHLTNFEINNYAYLPLYCFFLLPIFVLAIFTSYLRLKIGFIFAILLHSLNNMIPLLIYYLRL